MTDRGQNQQLFDFWSFTTFQSRPKKMQLLDAQVVDLPINDGDFPVRCVRLPEGNDC